MIRKYVSQVLSSILNKEIHENQLESQTNLLDEFALTSLEMMYFIVELESKIGKEIDLSTFDIRFLRRLEYLETHLINIIDEGFS